jgi:8-oxo-dGTP diphosphatase
MPLVVGAAIVHQGRVLAARRTSPPETAGGWEFPGGKVEAGETPEQALVREIAEELDCEVEVIEWLPGSVALVTPLSNGELTLRVAHAGMVSSEPTPGREHDAVRWLAAGELDGVPWLDGDIAFLGYVREVLRRGSAGQNMRPEH